MSSSDEITVRWSLSEADHLAYAWGGFLRQLPLVAIIGVIVPGAAALIITQLVGAAIGLLLGAALGVFSIVFSAVRTWWLRRSRVLQAVRARALSTSEVTGVFSATGVVLTTLAGRAELGWGAITVVRPRFGFLVFESRGINLATIPLDRVPPGLAEQCARWRADPQPPPELETPANDARYDLKFRVEAEDSAAVARRVAADLVASREPRFTILLVAGGILSAAALLAAFLPFGAPTVRGLLALSAVAVAGLSSGKLWIPALSARTARQRFRRHQRGRETRLLCGPGGFVSIGEDGVGTRGWAEVQVVFDLQRWLLFVSSSRAVVVPRRAFASDREFHEFGTDVKEWVRRAPEIRAPLPSVGRATVPAPADPWEPPR